MKNTHRQLLNDLKSKRVGKAKLQVLANRLRVRTIRYFKKGEFRYIIFPSGKPQFNKQVLLRLFVLFIFFGSIYLWFLTRNLPSPDKLATSNIPLTTHIYDRNGKLLYDIYLDKNRTAVKLADVPVSLKNATIAIEDKDFYKHRGFDLLGITRAAKSIIVEHNVQGGSTITQQLVKTVFLSPERTLPRKLKELYLSLRVETAFSKDEILQNYLNNVPYGGTAWGVETAAQTYFGKSAKDLDLSESALIAGLPASPTIYSPFGSHPELAKERQKEVLHQMVENKFISQDEADKAAAEELKYAEARTNIKAPHFVAYVREILAGKYGDALVEQGGLKVTTSLDLDLQEKTQQIVADEVAKLERLTVSNGAGMVTNPKTGEILAMVGSHDYFDQKHDGNVNIATSLRQPGSSIKPINYAKGFLNGLTPATIVVDAPTTFSNGRGQKGYTPVNYDGKFHGAVTLRAALGNSYNIPAVKVLAYNTTADMIDLASKMGITTFTEPDRYGLSLTLGGGEVKMVDMATAFGVFANLGTRQNLVSILKVEDKDGKVLEEYKEKEGEKVLSPAVAFQISDILADNDARSAAFGPSSALNVPGKIVSVKTGTTDSKRDNWTIGYTPSRLVVTWVGNNDNTPMNPALTSGITGAAPIWNRIMREALKDKRPEPLSIPKDIYSTDICARTGTEPVNGCPTKKEYFVKGTGPNKLELLAKRKVWVDNETGKLVEPNSPNASEQEVYVVNDFYKKDQGYCVGCIKTEDNSPTTNQTAPPNGQPAPANSGFDVIIQQKSTGNSTNNVTINQ